MPEHKNIQINESRMNSFLEKVFGDISGTYVSLMCCIGDRLDLFKKLKLVVLQPVKNYQE
jgi:hypothetical protein